MRNQLHRLSERFPKVVMGALYQEAQIEMTESKKRCPVDVTPPTPHPGLLRSTGKVHQPEQHGETLSVTLSYGTDYAVYVHEILENLHPVGQAKFLESVLKESAPYMPQRLTARIGKLMGGGKVNATE